MDGVFITRASEVEAKSPSLFRVTVLKSNFARTDVSRTSQSLEKTDELGLAMRRKETYGGTMDLSSTPLLLWVPVSP